MKTYLAYLRVSRKPKEGDPATSIPFQERTITEYAARKGIQVLRFYQERHSAAKAGKRSQFYQMLEQLQDPAIDGALFHKLDRSSRNIGDFALLEKHLAQGKDIRVINGEFDTSTAAGRLAFRNFCNLCVWYSENLSEEVTAKMGECRRQGYYPSRPPLGYRNAIPGKDQDLRKKYPDEILAPFVRKAFKLYASGSYSVRSLAAHLRACGMTNSQGKRLRIGSVETLLGNPFYFGLMRWHSQKTGATTYHPGNHEPLITKELFDEVQSVMKERRSAGDTKHNYTYRKLIRCECGRFLVSSIHRGHVYLECKSRDCSFRSIREDRLEDQLLATLAQYQISRDFSASIASALKAMGRGDEDDRASHKRALESRESNILAQIDRVNDGLVAGALSATEAIEKKNALRKELQEITLLARRLNQSEKSHDALELPDAINKVVDLAMTYKNLNPIAKRELLIAISSNICHQGGILRLQAKKPFRVIKLLSRIHQLSSDLCHFGLPPLTAALLQSWKSSKRPMLQNGGGNEAEIEQAALSAACFERLVEKLLAPPAGGPSAGECAAGGTVAG